jgi:peptidoglycan/LPS O-acetylase OafA/YrhL
MDQSKPALRIDFIDYARGIAAMLVLLQHSLEAAGIVHLSPGGLGSSVVNFGETGVITFFLVSGYIIPFSLEKKGSVLQFWIGRVFRIYPMYLFAFAVACLTLFNFVHTDVVKSLLLHLVFIQEYVLRDPADTVPNSWTLSLEMVWYILFSCLFLTRFNHKHVLISIGCIAVLLALTIFSCVTRHQIPMGRVGILATCVCGFLTYRWNNGQISSRSFMMLNGSIIAAIVVGLSARFYWLPDMGRSYDLTLRCVLTSWTLAYLLFFGFMAARHSDVWGAGCLAWLGRISYSVYLVHPFFIYAARRLELTGVMLIVFTFCMTVGASMLTYRFIELPGIAFGRRLFAQQPPKVLQNA